MRAFAIEEEGQAARLTTVPEPGPGDQFVIAVRASSINGFDVYQASGALTGMMEHRFPTLIGRDLAGVVEKVGPATKDFAVGDEVFGFVPSVPPVQQGTFAERISGEGAIVVPMPAGLDFNQAAALPLAGTAALDLLDAADLKEGDVVLVVGATGGVGSFVVQLAAARGAIVIATADVDDEAFVQDLGASHVVKRTEGSVTASVRELYPDGISVLIDVSSQGEALNDLGSVVRPGGKVLSLVGAADSEYFAKSEVAASNVNAAVTTDKLERLGAMAASGELRVPIQALFPLDQVDRAFEAFQRGKRGKLVLQI